MSIDKNKNSVMTEQWLAKRFYLFEKFYLPSMEKQINKNFVCFIYFDTDTPSIYKKKIKEYERKYKFFKAFFVNSFRAMNKSVLNDVRNYCSDVEYVITTRIDNDDSLHEEAIDVIQKNFIPKDKMGFNFYKGYRLVIEPNEILLKNRFLNGPFLSFIEKPDENLITLMNLSHQDFFLKYPTKQIKDKYYWVQVIHNANLVNDISGIPSCNKKVLASFGINDNEINIKLGTFLKYQLFFWLNIKNFIPFKARLFFYQFRKNLFKKN